MNKFKSFLFKCWAFIRKFPVVITLSILIPSLLYTGRFIFSARFLNFGNLYFKGNSFNYDPSTFKIKGWNKVFKVPEGVSSLNNFQGATIKDNEYVLVANNFEVIMIYNLDTYHLEHIIYTGYNNTEWHCNNVYFGTSYCSTSDEFPLLYCSMESEKVHATIAFRIYQKGGDYKVEPIQKITFEGEGEYKVNLANSYLSLETESLYLGGYTNKDFYETNNNQMKYYRFPLPDYRVGDITYYTDEDSYVYTLPAMTANQGGFVSGNILYQAFSFNEKEGERVPKFRVIDLDDGTIYYSCNNTGEITGLYDEIENVVPYDGRLFSFGIKTMSVYEMIFEALERNE